MLVVLASCSNSPKTPEVIAKNPATLKVYSFQEYYPVGATVDKVSGTLLYTPGGQLFDPDHRHQGLRCH